MTTQGKRLKKIRTALEYSQEALGAALNVSKQYVSNLEADRNVLNNDKLAILIKNYNVNLNFLMTGNGEMFLNNCENTHSKVKNDEALKSFESWGDRFSQLLSENQLTSHEFSKITGVQESRVEAFVVDSVEPRLDEINKIKSNFDVLIDWLLYGESVEKSTQADNGVSLSADEILKLKKLLKS